MRRGDEEDGTNPDLLFDKIEYHIAEPTFSDDIFSLRKCSWVAPFVRTRTARS